MNKKINFKNILDLNETFQNSMRIWRNQEFVRNNMFNQKEISEFEHSVFIKRLKENEFKKYIVAFYELEPFGVMHYDFYPDNNEFEFGFYLIEEKYLNCGFGVILEFVLLEHAFYDLKVKRVLCRTLSSNKKAISLHKKFGFKIKEIQKNAKFSEELKDVHVQMIDCLKWENKKEHIERVLDKMIGLENLSKLNI